MRAPRKNGDRFGGDELGVFTALSVVEDEGDGADGSNGVEVRAAGEFNVVSIVELLTGVFD